MTCETRKIDSNIVGLSYAEEACLGVLPGTIEQDGVWYPLDPNDYSDFGAEIALTARNTINASRQQRKGVVTDLDASGGFSQDLTQSNLTRLMQGFFFADARERVSNSPLNGAAASTVAIADIEGSGIVNVAVGKGSEYEVGMLVKLSGFVLPANNIALARITAIATDELTLSVTTTAIEAYTVGTMEIVGYQYGTGDLATVFSANVLTLTSTVGFSAQDYQVGEWIFVGGDATATKFALGGGTPAENAPGYARIEAVAANTLTLKEPTWTPLTDAGTGKTVQIFFGKYLRNEAAANIVTRSYQLERTLGSDANGVQSEVLVGAIANEFTLNVSSADKLMCDLSFVGIDNQLRDGTTGVKTGNRNATLPVEDAYNTSSDVYQQRLYVHGVGPTPVSLFAYVTEATININNNATGRKAIGTLGSFAVSVGDFSVSGSLEVYFATVAAVSAVKANSDVGYNLIVADNNAGFVYDIPLLSLGGGRVTVEKDEPIMLPLEKQAAQNANGYTMSATYFSYLPAAAMPA
jgi:hypothetical protein